MKYAGWNRWKSLNQSSIALRRATCVFALAGLYSAANGEHDEENLNVLEQLIKEHFDNQFLDGEIDLMISLLKTVEDELGMDITLLIDKLMRIQNILLKDKSVVESIEFY